MKTQMIVPFDFLAMTLKRTVTKKNSFKRRDQPELHRQRNKFVKQIATNAHFCTCLRPKTGMTSLMTRGRVPRKEGQALEGEDGIIEYLLR
jgi:hypothetical protein